MKTLRCIIMRGGTSKGVYIHENELPPPGGLRDRVILDIFGSPDVREIDGLGGADLLTSKVCIIGPCDRDDADVDYTFGQVIIDKPLVDYSINCGNLSSGVGPFAIDEGIVKAVEPFTTVRIYNTNTKKILVAKVPVKDGKAAVAGDYRIDGVPGTGAKIALDFAATAGTVKGELLPTGKARERITVEGLGNVEVSIVDAANPTIFAFAESVGVTGNENFKELLANTEVWRKTELIRGVGAEMLGFVKDRRKSLEESPAGPFAALVSRPSSYVSYVTDEEVPAGQVDLRSIIWAGRQVHKAYAVTGTICTGAAAMVPGTLVNEVLSERAKTEKVVRIGHPSGIIDVAVDVVQNGGRFLLKQAVLHRTARRIMEGYVFLKPQTFEDGSFETKTR